jgi:hypothetical protein
MAFAGWSAREPMNFMCSRLCSRPLQKLELLKGHMAGVVVDLRLSTLIEVWFDE